MGAKQYAKQYLICTLAVGIVLAAGSTRADEVTKSDLAAVAKASAEAAKDAVKDVPLMPPPASSPALAVAQPSPTPGPVITTVPVKVLYVVENQPVQIVDSQGRLLQVIYLKRK